MIRFETGKTYGGNFICDSGSWYYFEVVRRTEKSVWLRDVNKTVVGRRKIEIDSSGTTEMVSPFGTYSMSPVMYADRKYDRPETKEPRISGFDEWQTGGGCTALARRFEHDGHSWEVLITDGDLSAPASLDQDCTISVELDEEYIAYVETTNEAEARSAIAALLRVAQGEGMTYTAADIWPEYATEVPVEVPVTVKRY